MRPGCALARVMTYRGEWRAAESTAGGCTAGLFQFNPRLRITSTAAECTVYVTLSVPDLRFLKPDADQNPELFERYGPSAGGGGQLVAVGPASGRKQLCRTCQRCGD